MKRLAYFTILLVAFCCSGIYAQERVYVSTDKDIYLSGENLWCSVYCLDDSTGEYSNLSDVAYLQFVSREGVGGTLQVALV